MSQNAQNYNQKKMTFLLTQQFFRKKNQKIKLQTTEKGGSNL